LAPGQTQAAAAFSRYIEFDRDRWKALRASTPLLLSEADVTSLRGINDQVSLSEVSDIYVPLSRLLNLHFAAVQHLYEARQQFLGVSAPQRVPYIVGIAGSVAVGKSTFARVLRASLARWPDHRKVDLVTTDGFLYPNAVLEARGLMKRKGFPESYDQRLLLQFLTDLKAGGLARVEQPDILILEGLNVLQSPREGSRMFVSDFFDFSIYMDADDQTIEMWYIERFLRLRETVFRNENSYFHRYSQLTESEAIQTARRIWEEINLPNLRDNIGPTKERAQLILEKGASHQVDNILLRRI